jgi:hypothetical protein
MQHLSLTQARKQEVADMRTNITQMRAEEILGQKLARAEEAQKVAAHCAEVQKVKDTRALRYRRQRERLLAHTGQQVLQMQYTQVTADAAAEEERAADAADGRKARKQEAKNAGPKEWLGKLRTALLDEADALATRQSAAGVADRALAAQYVLPVRRGPRGDGLGPHAGRGIAHGGLVLDHAAEVCRMRLRDVTLGMGAQTGLHDAKRS